jgi:hypothetical protein
VVANFFERDPGNVDIVEVPARIGAVVPGTGGGVWQTFKSMAVTPDGRVLVEGTIRGRGISAMNNHVLCGSDRAGDLHVVLQAGVTRIRDAGSLGGTNNNEVQTVKTFEGLQALVGSTGVTRAFNGNGQVVFTVTFQDSLNGGPPQGLSKRAVALVNLP